MLQGLRLLALSLQWWSVALICCLLLEGASFYDKFHFFVEVEADSLDFFRWRPLCW